LKSQAIVALTAYHSQIPKQGIVEWAEGNIDYGRVASYDAEWKGGWRIEYMPYWREPLEWLSDPDTRELWALACSRCGKSENLLLTPLRYWLATSPRSMLYVSGQQQSVERFVERRIKDGMNLSEATANAYALARVREHEIFLPDCDIIATWPGHRAAFKQSGYPVVLADEVSTWPDYSADMLRERMANYSMPVLIGVSSPDPQQKRPCEEDPIFNEYEKTDRCEWMCLDPKTGNRFKFELGGRDTEYGLRWDHAAKGEDGRWDLNAIEETAYYMTPDGTRIDEKDRLSVVATGTWTATAQAKKGIRGVRVTRFMVPFKSGSFGHIARRFLEASAKGEVGLRVFVFEYLAEKFWMKKQVQEDSDFDDRMASYSRGSVFTKAPDFAEVYKGKPSMTVMTVDVQQETLPWVVREWCANGDSGLVDCGECRTWRELFEIKAKYGCKKAFIDNSYTERRMEVFEECLSGMMRGAVPMFGRENLKMMFEVRGKDPFEGTARQGRRKIPMVTWNTDEAKNGLHRLICGRDSHAWRLPSDIHKGYLVQMQAEECIDGKWIAKNRRNHFWDCEAMQVVAATVLGYFRHSEGVTLDTVKPDQPEKVEEPVKASKATYHATTTDDDDDDKEW